MSNVKLIKYVEKSFNSKPAFLMEIDDITYISNYEIFEMYTEENVQILIEKYDCGNEIDELLNQPSSITDWSDVKDGSYAFVGCKERIDISYIRWDSLVKATAMFNHSSVIGPEVLDFKELKTVCLLFNKCTITGVKHITIPKATSIVCSFAIFKCFDLESIECDNVKFISDSFNHNEEQYSNVIKISLFSLRTSIRSFYRVDYNCLEVLNVPNLERVYTSFSYISVNKLKCIKQSKVTTAINSFNVMVGAALDEISFNVLTKSVGNFLHECVFNSIKAINLLELINANYLLNSTQIESNAIFNLPKLEVVDKLLNYCFMNNVKSIKLNKLVSCNYILQNTFIGGIKLIELNELVSVDEMLNDGVAHELETISLDKLTKVKDLCNNQTLTSLTKLHLPSLRTAERLINYSSMNSILELDIPSLEVVKRTLNESDLSKCNNISIDKLVTVDVFMNGGNFESLEKLVVNCLHNTDALLNESKFSKLKRFETNAMFRPITLEDLNENKGRCRKIVQVSESEHSIN